MERDAAKADSNVRTKPVRGDFQCNGCKRKFNFESGLQRHLSDAGVCGKMCEVCGATFATQSGRARHVRVIHGEQRFECDRCDVTFSRCDVLKNHISSVHLGVKNFECNECDVKFAQKVHLRTHVREVHLNLKDFQCEFCKKFFAKKLTMELHIETVHQRLRLFKCDVCKKNLATLQYLRKHKRRFHQEES